MELRIERYYYIRDDENRPIITVCLIKIGKQITRGIAICSDLDNPCKAIGKSIAQIRAIKALIAEKSSDRINRHIVELKWEDLLWEDLRPQKAVYNPILTKFERKLLKNNTFEQQNLPGFLIEKGMVLYGQDEALCGTACQVPQTDDKIKIQINKSLKKEKEPVGIPIDRSINLETEAMFSLLHEIRELRNQVNQLENQVYSIND